MLQKKNNTRKRYETLLENLYIEVKTEEAFLHDYLNMTPEAEYLEGASDEMIDSLIRSQDISFMINNVLNNSDAALNLGPSLYRIMMRQINERNLALEDLYAKNYTAYDGRKGCLSSLENTDKLLWLLIQGQLQYLDGEDDEKLSDEFFDNLYQDPSE